MALKRFPLVLAGAMTDGADASFAQAPRASAQQTIVGCDLFCSGTVPPTTPAQFKITLDAGQGAGPVAQLPLLSLPVGQRVGENNVTPNIVVPANYFPGIVCVANGGTDNIVAWISYLAAELPLTGGGWVTLTDDDLDGHIAKPMLDAYTAQILTPDGDALKADVLAEAIEDVRGHISGYGPNQLGAEGTIPNKLKYDALNYAVATLYGRVQGMGVAAEVVKEMLARYDAKMARVSEGKVRIPIPQNLSLEQTSSPSPTFSGKQAYWPGTDTRRIVRPFSHINQDGI